MKTAMIVDDSAFMRKLIRVQLESLGFSVVCEAATGLDAGDIYTRYKPHLVTMDITLPDISGIEVTKHITGMDPDASIIMITAMGQQSMVIEALQAGAKDYVVKPFSQQNIASAVHKALFHKEELVQ